MESVKNRVSQITAMIMSTPNQLILLKAIGLNVKSVQESFPIDASRIALSVNQMLSVKTLCQSERRQ